MLIVSFDDLTSEDLSRFAFSIEEEQIIRFCVDIKHKLLCFGSKREDHIKQGEILLNQENETKELTKEEIARLILDHIIGGSVFINSKTKAFILLGGSSVEQGLNLILKKSHSKQTFSIAKDLVEIVFKKFYPELTIKVNIK